MAQATRNKLYRFRAPFVVTTAALSVACGGTSFTDGGAGGASGSAQGGSAQGGSAQGGSAQGGVGGASGSSGSAGTSSGGTAGNPAECPESPPSPYETCKLPAGASCRYQVQCQSGSYPFSFICSDAGESSWTVEPSPCEYAYDSCPGTELSCSGGEWHVWGGTNPPPPCPAEKPAPSSACDDNWGFGPNTCGYRCEGGEGWTVGTCHYWGDPIWAFDGTCANDCSPKDAELLDFVQANQACVDSKDCKTVSSSGCSARLGHCSGVFYVNAATDAAQLQRFDGALVSCMSNGAICPVCDGLPPAAACNSGVCGPAQTSP